jgi:hypothetical protein
MPAYPELGAMPWGGLDEATRRRIQEEGRVAQYAPHPIERQLRHQGPVPLEDVGMAQAGLAGPYPSELGPESDYNLDAIADMLAEMDAAQMPLENIPTTPANASGPPIPPRVGRLAQGAGQLGRKVRRRL